MGQNGDYIKILNGQYTSFEILMPGYNIFVLVAITLNMFFGGGIIGFISGY
jgi:hypothetical protein